MPSQYEPNFGKMGHNYSKLVLQAVCIQCLNKMEYSLQRLWHEKTNFQFQKEDTACRLHAFVARRIATRGC